MRSARSGKAAATARPGLTLITGASAGIGLALAEVFAAEGHDLVLVARSADRLAAAAGELQQRHGVACHWLAADLGEPQAAQQLFESVQRRGWTVEVLVNNAGVLHEGAFETVTLEQHLGLLQVNVLAATALCHRFLPSMLAAGRGRLLNICSTSSFNPVPSLATYAASKAYLLSFSEALALELRGRGVSVSAVCPGFTDTAMITQQGRKPMSLPLVPNLSADQVAREAYDACMAGQALKINGVMNQLMVEGMRHPPMWLKRELIALVQRWGI